MSEAKLQWKLSENRDGVERLLRTMRDLDGVGLRFGSTNPSGKTPAHPSEPSKTVAQILAFHEYGLGVPRRAIVHPVANGQRDELAEVASEVVADIVKQERSVDDAVEEIGDVAKTLLQDRLFALTPPLAPETRAKPGRAPGGPLDDTGAIGRSLGWRRDDS